MKTMLRIVFWPVALVPVLFILESLGYSFSEALFVGLTFMPCALLIRWLFPQIKGVHSHINRAFVLLGVLAVQLLLVLLVHFLIGNSGPMYQEYEPLPVLTSPFFLALVLGALALGYYFWSRWIDETLLFRPQRISFVSDRHQITLLKSEIAYIESRDSEVWIHTTDGRQFRNKTPITQWGNILGNGFIRIHRAFLVSEEAITGQTGDSVLLGQEELPVSRKYRGTLPSAGPSFTVN